MSKETNRESELKLSGIGERIRELRIRSGLTQTELAGGDVTRNMLSRIENGAALPSLPNLCRIADKLGVPPGAILGDLESYSEKLFLQKLSELFEISDYVGVLSLAKNSPELLNSNECSMLLCKTYYRLAQISYREGCMTNACKYIRSAENYLEACAESHRHTLCDSVYTLSRLIFSCPSMYEDDKAPIPDDAEKRLKKIIYDKNDLAVYLYALTKLDGYTHKAYSMPIEQSPVLRAELLPMIKDLTSDLYRIHIEAKLDLINADYLTAKAKLLTIPESEASPGILYDIYKDLEFCCKCCGDFENAYKYSSLRLELQKKLV